LDLLKELKLKNETVALFISDQRMPEMEGVEFLEKAKELFPEAKRVLLTAYSDIEAAIRAINTVKLDYYLLKPWNPPSEKLFPVVTELLEDWQSFYKPDHEGIRIIGFQWSPQSHRLKEFLSGNLVPYLWMDVEENKEADQYITSANLTYSNLPLVVLKDGSILVNPELPELATSVGLQQKPLNEMYDVLIIGAGPAGLAASVYGSCEGLKTLLVEKNNPGGQASSSARIENYLGFPSGLSGSELTRRAITQTTRFGTEILTPKEVKKISVRDGYKITDMTDGTIVHSKTIIIATGVAYEKLQVEGIEKFTGAGIYYGSAAIEAHACRNQVIYIIGGGNSACQAAMYMSKFAKEVYILIRRDALKQTAANYLVENISKTPNIKVLTHTEVVAVDGEKVLHEIALKDTITNEVRRMPAKAVFIYIGARPGTSWVDELMKNEKGFILTGNELMKEKSFQSSWKLERDPYMKLVYLEFLLPAMYALALSPEFHLLLVKEPWLFGSPVNTCRKASIRKQLLLWIHFSNLAAEAISCTPRQVFCACIQMKPLNVAK
jgi:thioredoxin reductase (NADPH)